MMNQDLYPADQFPFLEGGDETGALIRSLNWSDTPLGHPSSWPQSLKTCVRIILTSRQPMFVWWGDQLINIYNDAYVDIVGGKHPWALGQPATAVWREIWDQVGPRAAICLEENRGTYDEALLLIMERNGYPEETYYTFSYSPVPGDNGGTSGIICANTDDTKRIVGERELRTLKDLGKSLIDCKSELDIFEQTIAVLSENPHDFPFAFFLRPVAGTAHQYYLTQQQGRAQEHSMLDLDPHLPFAFMLTDINDRKKPVMADTGIIREWAGKLSRGAWTIEPLETLITPVLKTGQGSIAGYLVIGMNPYRQLDDRYNSFFQLLTDQVSTSLSNVHMLEQEKRRVEALAEIDRAKTTFFSNISHEFRTPLTLMRSPLEEVIRLNDELPPAVMENLNISYRNTLRLQKLVNTLLDFSKIEAGRMLANYEVVDISALTRDLASSFRSAIEKAGMELLVDCPDLSRPVLIDVDMWEKIVLNLLSNAFKYTKTGSITVALTETNQEVRLDVTDTGVGIPVAEMDRIFERFHRVQSSGGRSQEGTGIGLALVQELVKLQNGSISVRSEPGLGSTFTVLLPRVMNDTVDQPMISDALRSLHDHTRNLQYVEEAKKWIPADQHGANVKLPGLIPASSMRPRILLCDDNADMRLYISRLLEKDYDVLQAENGVVALAIAREQIPDLVISDVMMPELDGFGLIKALKRELFTAVIPIVLLSARAGEDETAEGLSSGADDYIVKPFTANSLLSRVSAILKLSKLRRQTEHQYSDLFMQAPMAICTLEGPEQVIKIANRFMLQIWGKPSSVIGKPLVEGLPEIVGQGFSDLLKNVYNTATPYYGNEVSVWLNRNGSEELVHVNFVYHPILDEAGRSVSILVIAYDVSEQLEARRKVADAEERLRLATENTGLATWDLNLVTSEIIYSPRLNQLFGQPADTAMTHPQLRQQIVPEDLHILLEAYETSLTTSIYQYEARVKWPNGNIRWIRTIGRILFGPDHQPLRMLGTMLDITDQRMAIAELRESEERQRIAILAAELGTWDLNLETGISSASRRHLQIFGYTNLREWSYAQLMTHAHPDDKPSIEAAVAESLVSGQLSFEARVFDVNQQLKFLKVNGTVIYNESKKPLRILGATLDVTESRMKEMALKRSEEQFRNLAHNLDHIVKERTKELVDANQNLERSNQELEQFAFITSHDLQEPLRKIQTFTHLLQDKFGDRFAEGEQEYLQKVIYSAERMSILIRELLSFSRLTKSQETFEMTDLNHIVSSILNDFELLINQKSADLQIGELPTLEANSVQMQQLFYNLIGNALKFTRKGIAPVISMSCREYASGAATGLPEMADRDEVLYAITVADNGIGFSEAYAGKIFEIFQQLNNRSEFEGTGIGLAIVRKVVDNHRGFIKATSTIGEGSQFMILLPRMHFLKEVPQAAAVIQN